MKIRFYPFVLERGEGCYVTDVDGNRYLDLCAGAGVMNTGYQNARVRSAIESEGAGAWSTTSAIFAHPRQTELAERLSGLVPGNGKVWFGNSGSEAMDMLSRYTRLASGRERLVSFSGSDHGQTAASAAISGLGFHADAAAEHVTKVPYPNPYRCPHGPCSLDGCSLACLGSLEEELRATGKATAAIFVEPVLANGGDIVPPRNFLPRLRELSDAYGCWLVIDEIKTGLGRTGSLFAFEHAGVVPDAVALGKALASGLPLSAVVGRSEILDSALGACALTLGGAPMPCAAALATLDELEAQQLAANAASIGAQLLEGLRTVTEGIPIVGDVRGQGLVLGIELVEDRDSKAPSPRHAARAAYRCFELGAVVIYTGTDGNVLELTPPLTLTSEQAEVGVAIIERALDDVAGGRFDDAKLGAYAGW